MIHTPLMCIDKAQAWALVKDLGDTELVNLIRDETHTCYNGEREHRHGWGYGCGTCPACNLRAVGWEQYRASNSNWGIVHERN